MRFELVDRETGKCMKMTLMIRIRKNYNGHTVVLYGNRSGSIMDPVNWVRQIVEGKNVKKGEYLFNQWTKQMGVVPLRDTTVVKFLREGAKALGLNEWDYASHSLKRGSVTMLKRMGWSNEDISLYVGWKCDMTAVYAQAGIIGERDVVGQMEAKAELEELWSNSV